MRPWQSATPNERGQQKPSDATTREAGSLQLGQPFYEISKGMRVGWRVGHRSASEPNLNTISIEPEEHDREKMSDIMSSAVFAGMHELAENHTVSMLYPKTRPHVPLLHERRATWSSCSGRDLWEQTM